MSPTTTPFTGLGARSLDVNEQAGADAEDLPPIPAAAPPAPWPFPDLKPNAAAAPPEEQPMPRKPARAKAAPKTPGRQRATRSDSVQFKVACVLLSAGDDGLDFDGIAAKLDGVTNKALSNALFNMKGARRAERPDGDDRWHLTETGRDWATGGANLQKQRATGANGSLATVPANALLVPVRPSFRCWVASDGSFAIEKNGHHIELELEETRQMLRYLDLVGEELLAAADRRAGPSPTNGAPNEQRH